jgi:hypothetical protein
MPRAGGVVIVKLETVGTSRAVAIDGDGDGGATVASGAVEPGSAHSAHSARGVPSPAPSTE